MKTRIYAKSMLALVAMVWYGQITPVLVAQNSAPAPAPASQPAPVQLSVDVWDVLRLAHGNVSDATITAYIKNSGKVYSLGASEILYLRERGLSDQVVTAMLEQRTNSAANVAQAAPQPVPTAPQPGLNAPQLAPTAPPSVWANNGSPPVVAAAPQPAPNYVEAAPVYAQPSPVYVYPPSYGYYDPWPYYWGYPAVSFSFGWGGHYGGYHGGGYHGGGYHGGGYSGGGHAGSGGHR
jgi:hypothetical protein